MSETPQTASVTPEDFDDLALFAGAQQEADDRRNEQMARENRAPISYVDEGSYWLRIYPEKHLGLDGKPKLDIARRIWSYTGLAKGVRRLPAPKDDTDPVRQEVQRLKDAGYPDAWKFSASEEGIIKVYIYRSSLPATHKYIKLNTPMFLVMRRKQLQALDMFLADMAPEDMRSVLNPFRAAPVIKMTYTKGSGGSSSFGFDLKNEELPALPEGYPSLFDVLITDKTQPATPEELVKIRKSIGAILAMHTNIVNPTGESGSATTTAQEREAQAKAAVAAALAQGQGKLAETAATPAASTAPAVDPACPGHAEEPKLVFGAHDPNAVPCVVCPVERECIARTAKYVAAGFDPHETLPPFET